jgi:hypothetical protein
MRAVLVAIVVLFVACGTDSSEADMTAPNYFPDGGDCVPLGPCGYPFATCMVDSLICTCVPTHEGHTLVHVWACGPAVDGGASD